jgi:iron-sulfur cluster insertion protein
MSPFSGRGRAKGTVMLEDVATSEQAVIGITENAARRIAKLIADEGRDNLVFRVAVSGGGCSGFQYGFSLDDQRNDDDRVFERDGISVVIDEVSLDLLQDSEVDFVEDLIGSYFSIKNPNASSTCGCGSSFSV